jgi:hypothetical protein
MKLRIRGQTLRIRTDPDDVRALAAKGYVEDRIQLSPQRALVYRLSVAPEARELGIAYQGDLIDVRLPAQAAREWWTTDRVELTGSQMNGSIELAIIVEKDFDPSE